MPKFISRMEVYFKQDVGGRGKKTRKQNLSIPSKQPGSLEGLGRAMDRGPQAGRENQAQAGGLQAKPIQQRCATPDTPPPTAEFGLLSKWLAERYPNKEERQQVK